MKRRNIIKFYNHVAGEVAKEWYDNESLLPIIKEFCSLLPQHPKVLDLGCGPGHEARRLHNHGADVVGVDISQTSIEIAKKRNPNCVFLELDFQDIDDSIGRFDGIFSAGSLIHMPLSQLSISVKTIISVLKIGGYFLIIFQEGKEHLIHYPEVESQKIERILYRFSSSEIVNVFKNAGAYFVKELHLSENISIHHWKALLFKKTLK